MNVERGRTILFAFMGAALATSISGAEIALALVLLDAIVGRRWAGGARRRSPLELPVVVFFAWGFAVTVFTGSAPVGKAISGQNALFFLILAVRCWSVDENDRWARWFLIGAAVTAAFAVVQVALNVDRYPVQDQLIVPSWLEGAPEGFLREVALRNERAVGTRSHPLTFAEGLLAAFVIALAAPLGSSPRWRRFRWAALAFLAAGLLFSQGRGVWLGAIGVVATLGGFWRRRREVRVGLALAALAAALVVMAVPKMRARALSIVAAGEAEAAGVESRNVRFELWSAAWGAIKERPLIGAGLKGVKLMVDDPLLGTPRPWSEAHNIFLQVAAERGVIGLGIFVWLLAVTFLCCLRAPPGWREAGVALFVGFMIAGLTESWVKDKEVAMIFWALVGAIERRRIAHADGEGV